MKVKLAYGRSGLEVDFPDKNVEIIEPVFIGGLTDETEAIRKALRNPIGCRPLREIVNSHDTVAIVFSDRTRPLPSDRILPVLLSELENVPRHQITLINALGTHRANTADELDSMLGRQIVGNFKVVQHNPHDRQNMVRLGRSRFDNEVWVNREFMQAKIKVLTGFIEPHFFAGFSGGPKSVLLGVAAFESILKNHSAAMIDHPAATWGVLEENPIHQEMCEIADLVKPDFILNVTLNRHRAITGVFAGNWRKAHSEGCAFAGRSVMRPVHGPFDVVVTTNSGFPLDMNLYQTVKGMSAASRIVKDDGAIIVAAECSDGVPDHGSFRQLLRSRKTPGELLAMIHNFADTVHDQWQVQILAKILLKSSVYLYSMLPEEEVSAAHLIPVKDISCLIQHLKAGKQSNQLKSEEFRVAVLPEGPQTVPYLV